MSESTLTYEQLVEKVHGLSTSSIDSQRDIVWADASRSVGVARDPAGRIEIYIPGEMLTARSAIVAKKLEHLPYYKPGTSSPSFTNRLSLPPAEHFDQVAAFLCTELLRNGACTNSPAAFRRAEPLVELALQRLQVARDSLRALCSELFMLRGLVFEARNDEVAAITDSWVGTRGSRRAFQLATTGVVIKSTTGSISAHRVNGIHEVTPGHPSVAALESTLYVVSMGIDWHESGEAAETTSLPQIVQDILDRISNSGNTRTLAVSSSFLQKVAEYDLASEVVYDHETMSLSPFYNGRLVLRFVRTYDISDDQIRIIRASDLTSFVHVDASPIQYRMSLPTRLPSGKNPVEGVDDSARTLMYAVRNDC